MSYHYSNLQRKTKLTSGKKRQVVFCLMLFTALTKQRDYLDFSKSNSPTGTI